MVADRPAICIFYGCCSGWGGWTWVVLPASRLSRQARETKRFTRPSYRTGEKVLHYTAPTPNPRASAQEEVEDDEDELGGEAGEADGGGFAEVDLVEAAREEGGQVGGPGGGGEPAEDD